MLSCISVFYFVESNSVYKTQRTPGGGHRQSSRGKSCLSPNVETVVREDVDGPRLSRAI